MILHHTPYLLCDFSHTVGQPVQIYLWLARYKEVDMSTSSEPTQAVGLAKPSRIMLRATVQVSRFAVNRVTAHYWLYKDILCRWGSLHTIVTDNRTPFIAATDWLHEKYGIVKVQISPYNSQANGKIECPH